MSLHYLCHKWNYIVKRLCLHINYTVYISYIEVIINYSEFNTKRSYGVLYTHSCLVRCVVLTRNRTHPPIPIYSQKTPSFTLILVSISPSFSLKYSQSYTSFLMFFIQFAIYFVVGVPCCDDAFIHTPSSGREIILGMMSSNFYDTPLAI